MTRLGGVDIILDNQNNPRVIEVNANPGIFVYRNPVELAKNILDFCYQSSQQNPQAQT
ncbi:MAG: hypothetical protein VXY77_02015 [Pseudomonadota bacterium]|nr:hypothetical protein [Pseudomonadota bacterium]